MARTAARGEAAEAEREFHFTWDDFEWIRETVGRETGIQLSEAKSDMVYSRLARRLRALGLRDFASYRKQLVNDPQRREMAHFVNALTTNLTAFFRESHHFDHLAGVLKAAPGKVRIWSAGCSTGEEVYSIAITAREVFGARAPDRVKIIGTDLDSNVLEHAARGIYDRRRVDGISQQRLRENFLRGKGNNDGLVRVRPELKRLVEFDQLNLLHDWPFREQFEIVFCRNVIIYFNKEIQSRLFERVAEIMTDPAWLYIGHSETLWKVSDRFESHGRTIYRKTH
ncbi:CheR family methyltransferase [Halorhodospira halochloris]|uniref:CheR family methyltransferase n=1 Tax=Halorhodospira halochloris TaxID=1052 RepID=UPI001EE83743|nr:protein-glutamate O-methyltransferase CheR [Halorhodospira halochloris]MCG5547457.1 protein-glutamate O-methyltransferase CheR [Halorhodospira halochloris]